MYRSPKPSKNRTGSRNASKRKSPNSPQRIINSALADLIIQTSEVERKIELTRQILVESRKFDAVKAFWRLDRRELNEVDFDDFLAFLEDHNLYDSEDEEESEEFIE